MEQKLGDLIEAALRRYHFDESITRNKVEQAYNEVVGEFIVKLTRMVNYETGTHTLKVTLASPALKNELTYKLTDLTNAINNHLGQAEVKKIMLL